MRALLALLALHLAAGPVAWGSPPLAGQGPVASIPIVIHADRVTVAEGVAVGEGSVSFLLAGRRVHAERFRLTLDAGLLVLETGSWARSDGLVHFSRAEVALGDATGLLLEARMRSAAGRWRLAAGALVWESGGERARASDAHVSLCACEDPPWSVSAREVRIQMDEVATFRAGWLEVCGQRAVPLPAGGIALADRRTGLLAPTASWGRDGAVLGAPVMLHLGEHADAVVTPEWRQARGLRGAASLRYALAPGEGGAVSVAAGPDTSVGNWRGQVEIDHGWAPGPFRTAMRGGWISDMEVFTAFGEDLVARTAPWSELLGVAGVGPVRLEMDRFTADRTLPQRPVSMAATAWGRRAGGIAVGGGARVDTVGQGTGLGVVQSPALRPLGRVGMDAGHWWGPVRADTQMRGQVSQPLGAEGARLQGRIRGRSALGVWGDVGSMRHLAEVGVAADVGGAHGAAAGLPDERAPRPWGFGPVLRSTWLTPRAVPVSFRAAVPWTRNGAMPAAAAATRRGAWTARAQGGRRLQAGALAWDDGIGLLGGGLVHRGSLLWADGRAAWSLPGPLRGVRPGYAGRLDVRAGTLLSHGPRLGWTSSCDCLRVDAGAVWSADREVPDIRLQVGIR